MVTLPDSLVLRHRLPDEKGTLRAMEEVRPRIAFTDRRAKPVDAWIMVGLLFLYMLINFADRAVLGLAAGPIMQDLQLTHTQFGLIGASFFTFFSLGAVFGGFLVDRLPTRWVLATLALIWSLCQLPVVLSGTIAALIANRLILGFSEGPAYPVAAHSTYKWFPSEHRALPTSLIAIGALAGNGIVAPVIAHVIAAWSWHTAFGLLGAIGLVWCVAWLALAHEGPLASKEKTTIDGPESHRPYRRLLGCRTVIGVQIVGFSAYWLLTAMVIWLPTVMSQAFGYTPGQAGWIMMLVSLCQIVLLPTVSAFSDGLQQRGVSSRVACGWTACASTVAAGLLTVLLALSERSIATVLLTVLAFSLCNVIFVLAPCLIAEVTPPLQRGAVLGVNTAIVTLAGPLAPTIMGMVVDLGGNPADGFRAALLLMACIVTIGGLSGFFLINPKADRVAETLG